MYLIKSTHGRRDVFIFFRAWKGEQEKKFDAREKGKVGRRFDV